MEIQIYCPHCYSYSVVKNGKKVTGQQNFKCKQCGKQFLHEYLYWGADPANKRLMSRMLVRGSGVSDIAHVLGVSQVCVLRHLQRLAGQAGAAVSKGPYDRLQIDELWSYVGNKKRKRWFVYAYCPEGKEIVAMVCGSRSAATVRKLCRKLEGLQVNWFCTDKWRAFAKVLPYEKHLIGKRFTKAIEGVNTALRLRNRRMNRKTTCFSKQEANHMYAMNITISYFNHHTF
nr:IS1 family transposase [Pontibacter sp. E15-1]